MGRVEWSNNKLQNSQFFMWGIAVSFFDRRSFYIAQAGLLTPGATCLSLSIFGNTVPALDVILSPAHIEIVGGDAWDWPGLLSSSSHLITQLPSICLLPVSLIRPLSGNLLEGLPL